MSVNARRWNVAPRYSPGSPAMVFWDTAENVVRDELWGYRRTLEGLYGEEAKAQAERLGLAGIVEERIEVRGGWAVWDRITGDQFFRPFKDPEKKELLGARTPRVWR